MWIMFRILLWDHDMPCALKKNLVIGELSGIISVFHDVSAGLDSNQLLPEGRVFTKAY